MREAPERCSTLNHWGYDKSCRNGGRGSPQELWHAEANVWGAMDSSTDAWIGGAHVTVPCVSVRTLQKLALTPVHASRCQTPICGHLPPSEPANFKRGAGMHSVVAVSISKHCMTYTAAQALWALEGPRQGEMICKAAVDPALILIICLWVRDVNDPQRFHRQPTNQVKPDRREHYSPLNRLFRAA
eukprot:263977-Rhodomonas_salina.2